jgi:hypothetical protein
MLWAWREWNQKWDEKNGGSQTSMAVKPRFRHWVICKCLLIWRSYLFVPYAVECYVNIVILNHWRCEVILLAEHTQKSQSWPWRLGRAITTLLAMDFIQQTVKTDGDLLQSITHTFPGFKMSKERPFLNNRMRRNNIHYGMVILQTPTIKYLLLLPRPHLLHLFLIAFTRYLNTSSSRTFHSQTTPPGIP